MFNLKNLAVLSLGVIVSTSAIARKKYPQIYPFVPMDEKEILSDVERISEDPSFIKNFKTIVYEGLSEAKTDEQPWTSSYWPLAKGTIADPYENSTVIYYGDFVRTYMMMWKSSKKKFDKRLIEKLKFVDNFSQEELDNMAPSEKYDVLLGDKEFGFTKRLMNYMGDYGANNYFWTLDKILVSGTDTLHLAELYTSWGWYSTVAEALEKDIVLQPRLESKMALQFYNEGIYSSIEESLVEATPLAQEDSKNYVLADRVVKHIASWEGICNGWSTAAGLVPRPRKMVSFDLPNDKKLNFYPDDIKGLISQYWFNSFIQNNLEKTDEGEYQRGGTINVGLRCNLSKMKKDKYGRYYDHRPDPQTGDNLPRCVGVHPAKWHMGLVNIIGKQGRSFIVERKVESPVDNHPMYKYDMKYFNPNTGNTKNPNFNNPEKLYGNDLIMHHVVEIDRNDQFQKYRNSKAKYIVGVETTMYYMNYVKPVRREENSEEDDDISAKVMFYDLELDSEYNIVGGQWRAVKSGIPGRSSYSGNDGYEDEEELNHKQPDFFWTITKDWKKSGLFNDSTSIPKWNDTTSLPPASWLAEAKKYHSFEFIESTYYNTGKMCNVRNTITGEVTKVWCEHKTNRPQPLSNVVNKLIELSSGKSAL